MQVGRRAFPVRRAVICQDGADAQAALASGDAHQVFSGTAPAGAPAVAFLFPGQGTQYLHMAHEIRGFLSPETMDEVAERLELSPAYVRGVASFYTMYNLGPVGKYLIQVCTNISCNLCGGDAVFEAFLKHTGTEAGETSANGLWTVMHVPCLAIPCIKGPKELPVGV